MLTADNNRRPRHSVAPPLTQRGTCTGPCTQFRPPLPASCSAGPPSANATTPPSLLLGGAAERKCDHPSQPPARRGRRAQMRPPLLASCSARPPSAISTTPPDLPYRRGGVLWWGYLTLAAIHSFSRVSFLIPESWRGFLFVTGNVFVTREEVGASEGWGACRPTYYTKQAMPASCHACHKAGGWYLPLIDNADHVCVLPRPPQGGRLASTALFFLRQRRCLPFALRGLNDLKDFKDLSGPSRPSRPFLLFPKQTPPLLRSTPSNLEGDVHGAVHTISTTPPDLPCRRGGGLRGAVAEGTTKLSHPCGTKHRKDGTLH